MLDKSIVTIIEELREETSFDASFFEKDWYTTQLLNALAKIQDPRFQLVFSGGTSLSKGYQLIQRFSEDIDFKVVETQPGLTRTDRREFRRKIAEAINSLAPDLILSNTERFTRKEGTSFFNGEVSYRPHFQLQSSLRDCIQLELNFRQPTLAPSIRQLSSIVTQFTKDPPEVAAFHCVSLAETAADKIGALSWRVVGIDPAAPEYDPRLIRHLYDLYYLAPKVINDPAWLNLTLATVEKDITRSENASGYDNLTNRFKTSQDLLARLIYKLGNNRLYQEHYQDFVEDFTYGRSLSFDEAIDSLSSLIARLNQYQATPLDKLIAAFDKMAADYDEKATFEISKVIESFLEPTAEQDPVNREGLKFFIREMKEYSRLNQTDKAPLKELRSSLKNILDNPTKYLSQENGTVLDSFPSDDARYHPSYNPTNEVDGNQQSDDSGLSL